MDPMIFIEIFRQAIMRVSPVYYTDSPSDDTFCQVIGGFDPEIGLILRDFFSHYGERVFCYELYHQVRSIMDCERECGNLTSVPNLVFHAELVKGALEPFWRKLQQVVTDLPPLERNGLEDPIAALSKEYVPDFLLHQSYTFNHQEVVVEVKGHPELSLEQLTTDLLKLKEFIERYRYKKGIFVSINAPVNTVLNRLRRMTQEGWAHSEWTGEQPILIMIKPNAGADIVECGMCPPSSH